MYLLDTNTCIRYLNGRSLAVFEKVNAQPTASLVVCSIVVGELRFGALQSQRVADNLARQAAFLAHLVSLPFDDAAAHEYARIRADLTAKGNLIGGNDMMIAGIALAHNLIVVTHNVKEFGRVAGLRWEDWET